MSYMLSYLKLENLGNIANKVEDLNKIMKILFPWVQFRRRDHYRSSWLTAWEEVCDTRYKNRFCFIRVKFQSESRKFIIKSPNNLMVIDEEKEKLFLSCKWVPSEQDNTYHVNNPLVKELKEFLMKLTCCNENEFLLNVIKTIRVE